MELEFDGWSFDLDGAMTLSGDVACQMEFKFVGWSFELVGWGGA